MFYLGVGLPCLSAVLIALGLARAGRMVGRSADGWVFFVLYIATHVARCVLYRFLQYLIIVIKKRHFYTSSIYVEVVKIHGMAGHI